MTINKFREEADVMDPSKVRLRKKHGMREPRVPADPEVLSRRHLHEAVARWELKWHWRLHLMSFIWAFLNILLPVFSKSWKFKILNTPFLSLLYHEFAGLGFFSMFFLAIGLGCSFYSQCKIDGKDYSEYGYPINLRFVGSSQDVIEADLYPRTKIEERVYVADSINGIWMSTLFWFTIFGGVAHVSY